MKSTDIILAAVLSAASLLPVCAQNGTNSPYSRYGLGKMTEQSVGINRAMGGTGIGLRERNTLNTLNPASYSSVDTLTFLLDFGFSLSNDNYKENGTRINARNSSVDYLSMQFRIARNLGFTASLLPFSTVGYCFSDDETVRNDNDGTVSSTNSFAGEGGLRQVNAGLGWAPFRWLSVGADIGYVFGEITHSVTNSYSESSVFTHSRAYYAEADGLRFNFGLQTAFGLGEGKFCLGLVYSPLASLKTESYVYNQTSSGSNIEVADTVTIPGSIRIADRYGAGVTYSRERWMAGADVTYERWSNGRFFGLSGCDRLKISAGGMFRPEKNSKKLFRRTAYRAGVFMNGPYFNVGAEDGPAEYGMSLGMSLPVINKWNNMIEVNVSGQYAHVRPSSVSMITENCLRLNVGIAFNERWFVKWMVE